MIKLYILASEFKAICLLPATIMAILFVAFLHLIGHIYLAIILIFSRKRYEFKYHEWQHFLTKFEYVKL